MNAAIFLFLRWGDDFHPHIVINDAGGDNFVVGFILRQKAQILGEKNNNLIHIEPNGRKLIPGRQIVFPKKPLPFVQLLMNKYFIIKQDNTPFISFAFAHGVRGSPCGECWAIVIFYGTKRANAQSVICSEVHSAGRYRS